MRESAPRRITPALGERCLISQRKEREEEEGKEKSFLEGEWNEGAVWPLLGTALFVAAFVSVLRDFRLSSPSKKGAKRR